MSRLVILKMFEWFAQGATGTPDFGVLPPNQYRPILWHMVKNGWLNNGLPQNDRYYWSFADPTAYTLNANGVKLMTKFLRQGVITDTPPGP